MKTFLKYFASGLLSLVILFVLIGVLNYNAQLGSYSPWIILVVCPICGWVNKRFWMNWS